MVAGDTIANSILLGYDEVVAQIRNTTTKDVDTDNYYTKYINS